MKICLIISITFMHFSSLCSETESSVFVSSSTTAVTFRRTSTGSGVGCTSTATRSSGEGSSAVYNEGEHLICIT